MTAVLEKESINMSPTARQRRGDPPVTGTLSSSYTDNGRLRKPDRVFWSLLESTSGHHRFENWKFVVEGL